MIPKIIHQTWKSERVPPRFRAWRETWRKRHPEWSHRLWTDDDNRRFIGERYEWFLPYYDAYDEHIMRVDAVRYFILDYYGGVYVDLDFECLRPLDAYLEGKSLVLGCEPPAHVAHILRGKIKREPLDYLVCNALMASVARHPFWGHVHQMLVKERERGDVLEKTGPFFLTRAVRSFGECEDLTLESHEVFYPTVKPDVGQSGAPGPRALAVHHWRGTWWRRRLFSRHSLGRLKFCAAVARRIVAVGLRAWGELRMLVSASACRRFREEWTVRRSARLTNVHFAGGGVWALLMKNGRDMHTLVQIEEASPTPVHCVMRASDFADAKRLRAAVEDYRRQSGVRKRLTIVAEDNAADAFAGGDDDIRVVRDWLDVDAGEDAGEGGVWARWGDYRSHPRRALTQLTVLEATGAGVCMLQRRLSLDAQRARLGACGRMRDTVFARESGALWGETDDAGASVALMDEPTLTLDFDGRTDGEGGLWEGENFARLAAALRDDYGSDCVGAAAEAPSPTPRAPANGGGGHEQASVLVLTPVKNAEPYIGKYMDNLARIDYPAEKISLAFLESDSDDATWERLGEELSEARARYARVELYQQHFGYRGKRRRWALGEQRRRREVMALSRNLLLSRALRDEQWVLWMDVDLLSWPPDALRRLLATGGDVVAPHCVREDGMTFDLNTFRLAADAGRLDWSRYVYDGILQPPVGYGREYLSACRGLVELDGVGGTMLLVNAELHRCGLNFPPYAYRHLIETEGLAQMAKDMGRQCWGLADLTVVHVSE